MSALYGADQHEQSHRSRRNEADVRPFRPAGAADQRSVKVPEPSFLSLAARVREAQSPPHAEEEGFGFKKISARVVKLVRSDSDIQCTVVSACVQNEDARGSPFRASGPTIRPERGRLRAIMQSALPSSSSSSSPPRPPEPRQGRTTPSAAQRWTCESEGSNNDR